MRRVSILVFTALALAGAAASCLLASATAAASEPGTAYTPETPALDAVSEGPWNTSQGDPSAGSAYPSSDLLPTFTPGGTETTLGGVSEPNLAVYPAATGSVPYPSGVAGTPGPLDGYCSSLGANPETGSPVSQPAGSGNGGPFGVTESAPLSAYVVGTGKTLENPLGTPIYTPPSSHPSTISTARAVRSRTSSRTTSCGLRKGVST